MGVVSADIPVLPEYMVQVVDDVTALHARLEGKGPRNADDVEGRWDGLKERLVWLVRMQKQWGNLHDIYDAQSESRFIVEPLPAGIRDPDSTSSAVWDLTSVVLLLYVSIMVPVRASFDVDVPLWSFAFFFDMAVDLFFMIDVFLNFRTAYYNADGSREERLSQIAKYYLSGWFTIDFVSCLPIGYIPYFFEEDVCTSCSMAAEGDESASSSFKAIKALRLVRLSKMLRLARIRKILSKYGNAVNLQVYVSVGFTLFLIFFLVHMLTCIFYVIGRGDQTLPNGVLIQGWVTALEAPESEGGQWDDSIGLGTRYITATYLVLNALENGNTDAEKGFALVSEFVRDFILGLVAGLITTVSMAMNSLGEGSQEGQLRLRDLKNWMQKKSLPKGLQLPIMEYCNELWSNRSGLNISEFLEDIPPTMRSTMLSFLYGATVARNPLFRGLSTEVINGLCGKARALYAMPNQKVMNEGESGREMYMVISGELEVLQNEQRLGFLSEGSFFGEGAVLCTDYKNEVRTRTVVAATDSELCYLTYEDLDELKEEYAELKARLARFSSIGQMRLTGKKGKAFFGDAVSRSLLTEAAKGKLKQGINKKDRSSGDDGDDNHGGNDDDESDYEENDDGYDDDTGGIDPELRNGTGARALDEDGNGKQVARPSRGENGGSSSELFRRRNAMAKYKSSTKRGMGKHVTRHMMEESEERLTAKIMAVEAMVEKSSRTIAAKLDKLLQSAS